MNLDIDVLLKVAKENSNAPLAKNERPSTYSIEAYEQHITTLLALGSLGVKIDNSLQNARNKLIQDYTLSGVASGSVTSRVKCDEFINTINKEIDSQMGRTGQLNP